MQTLVIYRSWVVDVLMPGAKEGWLFSGQAVFFAFYFQSFFSLDPLVVFDSHSYRCPLGTTGEAERVFALKCN